MIIAPRPQIQAKAKRRTAPTQDALTAAVNPQAQSRAQVLRHFRSVFNAVKSHFHHVEKHAGIGGAQVWALSTIETRPAIGMSDLASMLDIHQTTASNLVKGLLKAGLVRAEKNGPDKRTVQLHILETGRAVLQKVPAPFSGVLPKALSALDAKTLARLEQDLGKLLALLNVDPNAAKTPLASL